MHSRCQQLGHKTGILGSLFMRGISFYAPMLRNVWHRPVTRPHAGNECANLLADLHGTADRSIRRPCSGRNRKPFNGVRPPSLRARARGHHRGEPAPPGVILTDHIPGVTGLLPTPSTLLHPAHLAGYPRRGHRTPNNATGERGNTPARSGETAKLPRFKL